MKVPVSIIAQAIENIKTFSGKNGQTLLYPIGQNLEEKNPNIAFECAVFICQDGQWFLVINELNK